MLDVRRMQVLRAVISSGSISAAARNLGYTPSAISQQLAALEREAGAKLLERMGRGVRPTPAGALLSEHAEVVGAQLSKAETELADLKAGRTGR
jgi:molybdate transport repressor ModE-like protein